MGEKIAAVHCRVLLDHTSFALSKISIFSISKMLGDSRSNISAEMERNIAVRVETIFSNDGVCKVINIGWRIVLESLVCSRRQAET